MGDGQHHVDRVVVDLHELRVGGNAGLEVGTGGAHAVGGEQHVVGREVVAVLELHALAQVEAPARRLDNLPAFGKSGDDRESLAALGQAFVGVAEHGERECLIEGIGIE